MAGQAKPKLQWATLSARQPVLKSSTQLPALDIMQELFCCIMS